MLNVNNSHPWIFISNSECLHSYWQIRRGGWGVSLSSKTDKSSNFTPPPPPSSSPLLHQGGWGGEFPHNQSDIPRTGLTNINIFKATGSCCRPLADLKQVFKGTVVWVFFIPLLGSLVWRLRWLAILFSYPQSNAKKNDDRQCLRRRVSNFYVRPKLYYVSFNSVGSTYVQNIHSFKKMSLYKWQ